MKFELISFELIEFELIDEPARDLKPAAGYGS